MSVRHSTAACDARGRRSRLALVLLASTLAAVVACTGNSTGPTSSGTPTAGEPFASGAGPLPTHWPGNVIESTIGLGVADVSFAQIGKDLVAAVDAGDLAKLLTITNDVQPFLAANQKNIGPLQRYSETKSVGDRLAAAYAQMSAGMKQIHDSLAAGDGSGVTAGFATFSAGNTAYSAVRAELGNLVDQALEMKRHFNL